MINLKLFLFAPTHTVAEHTVNITLVMFQNQDLFVKIWLDNVIFLFTPDWRSFPASPVGCSRKIQGTGRTCIKHPGKHADAYSTGGERRRRGLIWFSEDGHKLYYPVVICLSKCESYFHRLMKLALRWKTLNSSCHKPTCRGRRLYAPWKTTTTTLSMLLW